MTTRSSVQMRLYDIIHLHNQAMTLLGINFLHLTISDIVQTRFKDQRSLQQGQQSNQNHITMHNYTPKQLSLPRMDFTHAMVSDI